MSVISGLRSLLQLPVVRRLVVRIRLFYFLGIRRRIKTIESPDAFAVTVPHNIKSLGQCNTRIDLLIKPLSVLESVEKNSKVLIIGPRDEHDLFTLVAHGFNKKGIRGLDLISYSPLIDLGDMHHTTYLDNTWDVVIVGWTLSYSSTPCKVAEEIIRIARNGAVIAIAVEYSTMTESDEVELCGYSIQERTKLGRRINSVKEILDLFPSHVDQVFFSHDAPLNVPMERAASIRTCRRSP